MKTSIRIIIVIKLRFYFEIPQAPLRRTPHLRAPPS